MIISFSVENFLSFKNRSVIDFEAGSIKEHPEHVYKIGLYSTRQVVKSIGVFGHNSSGKSNIIKGLSLMRSLVLNSLKDTSAIQEIQPFLLSTATKSFPSTFEVIFLVDNTQYRYGFSATSKAVESEWLFYINKRKEEKLFIRAQKNFSFEKEFKATMKGAFELFAEATRSDSLFITVLAQFNNKLALLLSKWFLELIIGGDTAHSNLIDTTSRLMAAGEYRKWVNDVIKKADLGILTIQESRDETAVISKPSFQDFVTTINLDIEHKYKVTTTHPVFNDKSKEVELQFFDLLKNESLGTQKFFGLIGLMLFALKERRIMIVDELDARFHSHLFESIVSLFNSNVSNPNGAQLLFTAHNTYILKKGLRRDQMVFIQKNNEGVSSFGSLYENDPKVRNDASFDKDYLTGKYGAIPKQLDLFGSND